MVDADDLLRVSEDKQGDSLAGQQRVDFIKTTLHYKRRRVFHFYVYLVHLHDNKIIPEKALYAGWTKRDLRIIPEILLPIE